MPQAARLGSSHIYNPCGPPSTKGGGFTYLFTRLRETLARGYTMTCGHCAKAMESDSAFCRFCGAAVRDSWTAATPRRLFRSSSDRKLGGVCGGLADYFAVDPTIVRLLVIILAIYPGAVVFGLLAYAIAWVIIPPAPVVPPLHQQATSPA